MKLRECLVVVLLACVPVTHGQDQSGAVSFSSGVTAFQSGNYTEALALFLEAQYAGRDDAELRYNLAVCYYRLQRWPEANALFNTLHLENPERDLIAYNLAVTEKKLGNHDRARDLFLDVALTSPTSELAALANRQYSLLARDDEAIASRGRWLAGADLSFGTDDNVVDPADLSSSNQDDSFLETTLTARWYSGANPKESWLVDGFAYLSRYQEVDEYDIDMADIGIKKYISTDHGFWYAGGRADSSQLGGEGYLQSLSFTTGTGGQLDNGNYWNAHYRYRGLSSLSEEFDQLQGSNQRLSLDYGGRFGAQSRWKMEYRYQLDDRDDLDYDSVFYSYSAQRHTVGANWAYTSSDWQASLRGNYRYSDFLDDNLYSDGSAVGRLDDRYQITARGSWLFTANWALTAEYSYTNNDSNIDTYDYDRQVIMVGVGWQL